MRGDFAGKHLRKHGTAQLGGKPADAAAVDLLGADERVAVFVYDPDGRLPLGGASADERHEVGGGQLAAKRAFDVSGDDLPFGDEVVNLVAGENLRGNNGIDARDEQRKDHDRSVDQHQHTAEGSTVLHHASASNL